MVTFCLVLVRSKLTLGESKRERKRKDRRRIREEEDARNALKEAGCESQCASLLVASC